MTSPLKIPTFFGFPANNVYANQYVAYIPINQITQNGVPMQQAQTLQHPHIVDTQSTLQHPAMSGGGLFPNAYLQPLPEKNITATGTQSLPNISNKQQSFVPIPPLPFLPSKQQSNENQEDVQQEINDECKSSDKSSSHQDQEVVTNENVMSQPQMVNMSDNELLKSIEFEKRTSNFKTTHLQRQVDEYNSKLTNLKKELSRRKRRLIILRKVYGDNWKEALVEMLGEREFDFNTYSETYEQRLYHERQLEIVEGQHLNLTAMAESLSSRLRTVVHEYQSLNSTLDPAAQNAADGWLHRDSPFCPDGAMAISNNAHFKQLVAQNRRLERQIKFVKGIIENEEARNDNH